MPYLIEYAQHLASINIRMAQNLYNFNYFPDLWGVGQSDPLGWVWSLGRLNKSLQMR